MIREIFICLYERPCRISNIYRGAEDIIVFMCYLKWAAFTSGKVVAVYEFIYRDIAMNSYVA